MKFIPFEKITYESKLPLEIIEKNIENSIREKKSFNFNFETKPSLKKFEGSKINSTFFIQRIINYRNSFLPDIQINLWQKKLHTEIYVKFKLKPFTVAILIISSVFLITILFSVLITEDNINSSILVLLLFLIIIYLMCIFGFNYEVNKAKKEFQQILKIENSL